MINMDVLVFLLLLLATKTTTTTVDALRHSFHTSRAKSLVGPIGEPFGFNEGGHFEITVLDFELYTRGKTDVELEMYEGGFFLQRFDNEASFNQHMEELRSNTSMCAYDFFLDEYDDDILMPVDDEFEGGYEEVYELDSTKYGLLLKLGVPSTHQPGKTIESTLSYDMKKGDEGLYFLIYQVCPNNPDVFSRFDIEFHYYNLDIFGNVSYLSVGEMKLPMIYFFFSMSYLICLLSWFMNIIEILRGRNGIFSGANKNNNSNNNSSRRQGRPIIYTIHYLMAILLFLKFLSIFFESVRYYKIMKTGHAEVLSFLFYSFTIIKGMFLFTTILLIGTGWSFVKPFLSTREKKIIIMVMILQVINNIALTVLSQETEGEVWYSRWYGLLHLVDIMCCCAVLIPIVWHVNELEKSLETDDTDLDEEEREMQLESSEKGHILSRLRKFRTFYLIVIAYIYATRILVYLFATMLNYKNLWVSHFSVELVTLTFYVIVGMMFRPQNENEYKSVQKDDDDDDDPPAGGAVELPEREDLSLKYVK